MGDRLGTPSAVGFLYPFCVQPVLLEFQLYLQSNVVEVTFTISCLILMTEVFFLNVNNNLGDTSKYPGDRSK